MSYVDAAIYRYGRMMADKIGVARRWFQDASKASFPHYDVCKAKRAIAVAAGAIEVDRNALVAAIRRIRASGVYPTL